MVWEESTFIFGGAGGGIGLILVVLFVTLGLRMLMARGGWRRGADGGGGLPLERCGPWGGGFPGVAVAKGHGRPEAGVHPEAWRGTTGGSTNGNANGSTNGGTNGSYGRRGTPSRRRRRLERLAGVALSARRGARMLDRW